MGSLGYSLKRLKMGAKVFNAPFFWSFFKKKNPNKIFKFLFYFCHSSENPLHVTQQ